nr:hypothetical protein [Tanacetum cinerariifolium]
ISLGPVFLLGLSAFAMVAACASRAAATPFVISISLGPVFLLGLLAFAMVAACASRAAANTLCNQWMVASVIAGVADRITPTTITDGERGFEQTKACYLQEVIPFFKTIKDNFEGIQKALTKEVKEMKDVFEELEAETQNDLFRAENDKIKQHYKELYNSIKITRTKHIEQVTKLTTENVNLKTCVSKATVNPQVSARDKHAIDVEPIVPRLRNNRDAHLDYLRHLKESVETIRDIVEEAKVVRPRDRSIVSACCYTKHSQELLEYAIGVNSCPNASGSQPKRHVKVNRILPAKCDNKLPVDDQPKKNKSHPRTSNRIDSSSRLKRTVINSHSDSICQTCNKCLTPFNHDLCVATCLQSAMATPSIRYNSSVE